MGNQPYVSDAVHVANHLKEVVALAERLAAVDLAIYEHQYNYLVFGSWVLVVGKKKELLRFNWDGKEGYLLVERTVLSDSRSIKNWERLKYQDLDRQETAMRFGEVEKIARTHFGV